MPKKIILCVDDELIIVQTLKILLKSQFGNEFYYETASSAEEGMEAIEELAKQDNKVVLIISDWLMPGIKGDEFLAQVKKKYPEIKSIIITGQIDQNAENYILQETGCFRILYKPWHTPVLFNTIKECLGL